VSIFQVWSEGYQATGNSSTAHYHGEYVADTFSKACAICFKDSGTFNLKKLTLWGCGLYDNESSARASFG